MDKTLSPDMDAHERVEHLIELLGKNSNSFSDALGVSSSVVYQITKGISAKGGKKTKPGFDLLAKICETFPQVNERWLLTGKGNPFLSSEEFEEKQKVNAYLSSDASKEMIAELKSIIQDQKDREKMHLETISNLSKHWGN